MTPIRNTYIAWILLLALAPISNTYAIEGLHLSLGTIDSAYIHAEQVRVDIDWHGPHTLSVSASARRISSPYAAAVSTLGIACRDVSYRQQRLYCKQGRLRLVFADGARLETPVAFSYDTGLGGLWQIGISRISLDLARIKGLLTAFWQGQKLQSGQLQTSQLRVGGKGRQLTALTVQGRIDNFSMEGDDVFENTAADIHLKVRRQDDKWILGTTLTLRHGAMYIIPGFSVLGDKPGFYLEIKHEPLKLAMDGLWYPGQRRLQVEHLSYSHPGVLSLRGSGTFDASGLTPGADYRLDASIDDLARAFPVYLQPLILQTSFSGIKVRGGIAIQLASKGRRLQRLNMAFNKVSLEDGNDRLKLTGLHGNLALGDARTPIRSMLSWEGIQFHRLPVGPGQVEFESAGANRVKVLNWKNVAILDGELQIDRFEMSGIGRPDFSLALDARLSRVSMKAFTRAMGWPLMAGNISGAFSGLKYAANSLSMNGDIKIHVFNGTVTLRDLRIADLISQFSVLTTDIDIQGLDLAQLTDTFEFGRIEGSLNGYVHKLRLEDWQPASFDARFETPDKDPRRHRISRKALNNLNELGGGLGGTMSRGFLRIFPSYSYGKLGLRCRLRNNIGELGGIRETDQGFYLLTRGGWLPPWVEVKAVGRSMPWNELIDGFKQISHGGIKIE